MDTQTKTHSPDHDAGSACAADEAPSSGNRWLSADWSRRSWWIKAPFLLAVAAIIIGAELGAHVGFDWLKHHYHWD